MQVIENFLEKEVADNIENTLTNSCFPWYYSNCTCDSDQYKDSYTLDTSQFCHGFYKNNAINSNYFGIISPIITKFGHNINDLIRIKANLIYRHPTYPESFYNLPHSDALDVESETILYYVNDSDGDTFIFNEKPPINKGITKRKTITPKKNRAILFNSSFLHASSPPTKNELRIVLNFVFVKKG